MFLGVFQQIVSLLLCKLAPVQAAICIVPLVYPLFKDQFCSPCATAVQWSNSWGQDVVHHCPRCLRVLATRSRVLLPKLSDEARSPGHGTFATLDPTCTFFCFAKNKDQYKKLGQLWTKPKVSQPKTVFFFFFQGLLPTAGPVGFCWVAGDVLPHWELCHGLGPEVCLRLGGHDLSHRQHPLGEDGPFRFIFCIPGGERKCHSFQDSSKI